MEENYSRKENPRTEGGSSFPLLITGMHRSGTSMTTRLLNMCGLHLGHSNRLLRAQMDNPCGFWENVDFLSLDDRILARLNGTWDLPPAGTPNPVDNQALVEEFRAQAAVVSRAVEESGPRGACWGWKDPRGSLLLPFWSSVLPRLRVVVCLRDPLEVAASLSKRNGFSTQFGLLLWKKYNERIEHDLLGLPRVNSIVTHYESLLENPEQELRRLIGWLGWDVSDEKLMDACASIRPALRHHSQDSEKWRGVYDTNGWISQYERMCDRAGIQYSLDRNQGREDSIIEEELVGQSG